MKRFAITWYKMNIRKSEISNSISIKCNETLWQTNKEKIDWRSM